jgi:hypothetical protein
MGPGMSINVSVNIPMNFWTFVARLLGDGGVAMAERI